MNYLLVTVWRLLRGRLQWRILWLFHDKFMIGVSGVVLNEDVQILLLRHTYWKPNTWGLPSGYANKGEKLEETLCREVREETGYSIEVTSMLRIVSGYKLRLEVNYLARLVGGDLRVNQREVIEAKFFSLQELPDGLLESHREVIFLAMAKTKHT